ncbi:enoyl-CoA hydratase/isomerase family protein [Evansella sp. LMS18]|uniref:enoyl-CoA hydratase/isomerase family protein n=1 Tax=Evansella sp. LMS18 TaxID=2924033 RepID=UPI0020D1E1B4|nr:enoyl-CoA hydratase/isomerase family protein [Evansella sp. LMS18]UTR10984.1 enoyl-CoA hydratase/isomerase family protein [Evansella sp. LMS18]
MKVIARKRSETTAEIVLNRPEKKNAVDFEVIESLSRHLEEFKHDEKLKVLLIRGAGDAFCGGGDLGSFHSLYSEEEALSMLRPMSEVLKKIASFPVITAVYLNGTAVGGGAELASAADFRFSGRNGKVAFIQGKLHIATGWGGASLLKMRVGYETALEMLGTARQYTMEEAETLKFVSKKMNSLEDVDQWSSQWLDAKVVREYKKTLFPEPERERLFKLIDKEVEACAKLWVSEEHHEAVKKFLNKN